ncbi:hypothetical protein M409DRAFT_29376 [Zasmidium cellare ATCC 36951]|uniref:HMG box domain-containing protein n=1 Tax=Zasmidium cellare ATCC 36951 TaxID=1080233 RepID=A0A6A6BZR2_ZASCE|nr:uncharacterized protein M409DRAFT_29376 [Zasmidium cellare ATCC 36951]KAF2160287.1 hypothetical protein M409DRAFT_29376 [Zasmidium cellare ATCC 36951]
MATQITFTPFAPVEQAVERFSKAVDVAVAACERGFRGKIAVSMSDITGIGGDALGLFKRTIDERALTHFALTADPDADLVCIEPGAVHASMPSTEDAAKKTKRPKNPFVIFRLDQHELIKIEFPGIHNNDISKIAGQRWRNASPEVKAEYAKRAEEEKRQHAIDHPGYKYQPRKPSEKKKRMTKNKLAKLAAQSSSTDATTNATPLPAQQNGQTTVSTVMPPHQNNTSQLTTHNADPLATFNAAQDVSFLAPTTNEQSFTVDYLAEQLRQDELAGEASPEGFVDVGTFFDLEGFGVDLTPVLEYVREA